MSSVNDPEGPEDRIIPDNYSRSRNTVESELFESLIHHLVEKGILTRNDALSVVQTVAEVKRGEQAEGLRRLEESGLPLRVFTASIDEGLNDKAYIVPGLGDAGDRYFGTY